MSSTPWSPGSAGGLPNSEMSAPAMNVRPAQTMTMACTAASAPACVIASRSPCRTCWLNALTGGLSTVITATRPRLVRSTDWVSFAMGLLVEVWVPPILPCGLHALLRDDRARARRDEELDQRASCLGR